MTKCENLIELVEQGKKYKICLPDQNSDYIQKKIAQELHAYEKEMLEDIAVRLDETSVVVDVGANVGNHSLYLASVVGCRVISFEPNAHLCGALEQSVKANKLSELLTVHNLAVGSVTGYAKLVNLDESNLGGQSVELVDKSEGEFEVVNLDEYLPPEEVSIIKVDVEGMEYDVLLGAQELIEKYKPLLYVECQSLESYEQVSTFLEKLGYLTTQTFNATPTHLFIHASQLTADQQLGASFKKKTIHEYHQSQEISLLRIKLQDANLKYRQATQNIDFYKSKIEEINSKVQESNENIQALEASLVDYRNTVQDLKVNLEQLEKEKISSSSDYESLQQEYTSEILRYKDHIKNTDVELKKIQEQKTIYQTESKLLSATLEDYRKELEILNKRLSTFVEKAASLEAENTLLEKYYVSLSEDYRQYQAVIRLELITLNNELQEQVKISSASGATSEYLKVRNTELDTELTLLRKEFSGYRTKTDGQVKQAFKESHLKKIETLKLKAELKDAESRISRLHQEVSVVKNKYQSNLDEISNLTKMISELDLSFQEKVSELESLNSRVNTLQIQNKQLQLSLTNQELAHRSLNTEKLSLEEDLKASQATLKIAQEKYRSTTSLYAELKLYVDTQQTLIDSINKETTLVKEQSSVQVLKVKQELARAQREIESLKIQKQQAEEKVVKTRSYISFRLGYAILEARKSFKGLLKLPFTIWDLRKDDIEKKKVKEAKTVNVSYAVTGNNTIPSLSEFYDNDHNVLPKKGLANLFSDMASLKVACIMDEFTYTSYAPTCNLLQLTPKFWQKELEGFKPDLLFIESAWRGKDDLWGNKVGHCSQEVQEIVAWANTNEIPSVFWNKEDPIHFETFLNTARLFDYVFTTDIDCINRYKAALGHEYIYFLPFAAQPQHSNPIEKYERKDAFCFAGAYYVRYPDRTRDLGNFVSQLTEYRPLEIYDRNYGKDDPNYQFPPEYVPYIVGNLPFEEIDKAYKGYQYAINLNSIKQSQTMFARRVYEVLASNTIIVSNFSRGIRLMFGDLVVVSDSGEELLESVKNISHTPEHLRKHKLAALRKVMQEHTYQDRLAYVISKVQGHEVSSWQPNLVVVGYAKDEKQFNAIITNFKRQTLINKKLCVVVPSKQLLEKLENNDEQAINVVTFSQLNGVQISDWLNGVNWVSAMVPDDYYGSNYLLDLVLATRYVQSDIIAKATHYVLSEKQELTLSWANKQYKFVQTCSARSSIVRLSVIKDENAREWIKNLYTKEYQPSTSFKAFSIDEFNYCKNGSSEPIQEVMTCVDDLTNLNTGIPIEKLLKKAERIQPAQAVEDQAPVLVAENLASLFKEPKNKKVEVSLNDSGLHIKSNLQDGQKEYIYANKDFTLNELGYSTHTSFYLDITPGLNIQLAVLFLDENKQRISHVIKHANRNQEAEIPLGTEYIRFGLRIYASGESDVKALVLGHRPLVPGEVIGNSDYLLLTNHYPSYEDLYRNGFVHSRVVAYKEKGIDVDIYRLRKDEALSYHEFKNIDVITGSQQALHKLIQNGHYKSILVHFLDQDMWEVLKYHIDKIKVFVWVHGADIQAWHRRAFNYETDEQRNNAKKQSDIKLNFWRELLRNKHPNLKLVFVSNYSAESSMEDLNIKLDQSFYEIIHNPIDTDLFNYVPKPAEQRKKILSIRPYASKVYANDLTVKAILELSKKPFFKELEFRLIGDGVLFDETVEPLRGMDNVIIEKGFLQQKEIAELHKQYGVFLCPTRMDSQGVSRDEAMSSGLVPITNAVAAVPEFVDDQSGFLLPSDNYLGLAQAIENLYKAPDLFINLSEGASSRVNTQVNKVKIISKEIELYNGEVK